MYQGYRFAFFLIYNYLSVLGLDKCDTICDAQGCRALITHSGLDNCTEDDLEKLPYNINFTVKNGESFDYPASLEINSIQPKKKCMYKVTLLANESINETGCKTYDFHKLHGTEVHTPEKTVCFFSNTTPYLNISYPHIFTACYAVQFSFDHKRYIFKKFLTTKYKRTVTTTPQLTCTYRIMDDNSTEKRLYFDVDLLIPLISEVELGLGSINNSTGQENCIYNATLRKQWTENISTIYNEFKKNTSNVAVLKNGKYKKHISFEINSVNNRGYCFYVYFNDERCNANTLWELFDCRAYKNCYPVFNQKSHHNVAPISTTTNYINWIVVIIAIILSIILTIVCFVYVANARIWEKFYVTLGKTNQKINEKGHQLNALKDKDTIYTDIVLLYPRGSECFMAEMAEFREILSKACQCFVHDWYNATECNHVATIGGFKWFNEMLHSGCHIIWVDTPRSRLLIARRFKNGLFVDNYEDTKSDNICDFRDIEFTTIFDLAKRNMEHSIQEHCKQFIVRIKGFESFENEGDPFLDLSSDTRYIIPQDLSLLCSNLSSSSESTVIVSFISDEDDS
ncbi:uncharacterized protein LOC117220385 isoform X2 [Megalopta genalis]|uniref:uncharacterized protein LOC117220385 isoform X2 n=1 Tax=Megalopta genalis TaxID=115081 RepID=UPI003FD4BA3B